MVTFDRDFLSCGGEASVATVVGEFSSCQIFHRFCQVFHRFCQVFHRFCQVYFRFFTGFLLVVSGFVRFSAGFFSLVLYYFCHKERVSGYRC